MGKPDNVLYLLGYPFGFTPQVYYQLVNGLGKGDFKDVNKGEFFNFKNVDHPVNDDHYFLMKKYENEDYRYWSDDYIKLKLNFLEIFDEYNMEFYIFRDTVEPQVFFNFLTDRKTGLNVIILDVDTDYLVNNMFQKKIFFPTNLIGYEETKEALEKSIELCKNNYKQLAEKTDTVEIVNVEDFFEKPEMIFDVVEDMGYSIKKSRKKNYLGEKVLEFKKALSNSR